MFSWKKSTEPPKGNTTNLTRYFELSEETVPDFAEGDYVQLKTGPGLPTRHGGCLSVFKSSEDENKRYACVIGFKKPSDKSSGLKPVTTGHVAIGHLYDLTLAVVSYGRVTLESGDSRMFCKVSSDATVTSILQEFVADKPVPDFTAKAFVRPRVHTAIHCHGGKISSLTGSSTALLSPVIVMAIDSEKNSVTVAGECEDGTIEEVSVSTLLLCATN